MGKLTCPIYSLNSEGGKNSFESPSHPAVGSDKGIVATQQATGQPTQDNLTWDTGIADPNYGPAPADPHSSGAYPQGDPATGSTCGSMPAKNQQYAYGVPYNNCGNPSAVMPNQNGYNGASWQNGTAGAQPYDQRSGMNNRGLLNCQESFQEYINTTGGQKELGKTTLAMQRDKYKSALKMNEFYQKQQFKQDLKERHYEIIEGEGTMMIQVKNGINQAINYIVFRCQIRSVRRYRREDGKEFFQLILSTDRYGTEVEGRLHDADLLLKRDGLKRTELENYEEGHYGFSEGRKIMRFVWEELGKRARASYDRAVPVMIPSKMGWHISEGHYQFYSRESAESWMDREENMLYSFPRLRDMDPMDVLEQVQKIFDPTRCPEISVLLYARLISLLGRILTDEIPGISFTIVGENAKVIASGLCNTFETDRNAISIDAERMEEIKRRIQEGRDTPMIIIISNPDNRSVQNRLDSVYSIQKTGMLDGGKAEVTFIYCTPILSEQTLLGKTVMVEETAIGNIEIQKIKKLFDLLQIQIVDFVEAYYGNIIQNYKTKEERINSPDQRLKEECKTIEEFVTNALKVCKLPEQYSEYIQKMLAIGKQEIMRRMEGQNDICLELFKKTVTDLTDRNQLHFSYNGMGGRFKINTICCDEKYYFFDTNLMNRICREAKICSPVYVKHQLAEKGLIKMYGNKRRREMQTDITAYDKDGNPKKISVTAIKRSLWDMLGGIDLWERGKEEC